MSKEAEGFRSKFSGRAFDAHNNTGSLEPQSFGALADEDDGEIVRYLSVDKVEPNFFQFRKVFDDIEELAESIREHGIIHPLVVFRRGDKVMIACGERRYRAAVLAGLSKVPCIIKSKSNDSLDEINFVENVQRSSFKNLERFCAIYEFDRRGYSVRRIMQMSGDKYKSTVSKASRIGAFANNACAAGFTTYLELAKMMEGVSINALYNIARISEKDMELAVSTLNEIFTKGLVTAQSLDLTKTVSIRLGLQPEPDTEDKENTGEQPVMAIAGVDDNGKPDPSVAAVSIMDAVQAGVPDNGFAACGTGFYHEPSHGDAASSQYEEASPVSHDDTGSQHAGEDHEPQSPLEPPVQADQYFEPEEEVAPPPKKKVVEKVQAQYNELDWPETKINTLMRQVISTALVLADVEKATLIIGGGDNAEKLSIAVRNAYDAVSSIEQNLARLKERIDTEFLQATAQGEPYYENIEAQ